MLELLTISAFVGYIIYLRYYADQRTAAQKEAERLREGIDLYDAGQFAAALKYFNAALQAKPSSAVAYLYRARIYRGLGDPQAALTDLNRGKSYDDTVADLHLETGQIHYEQGDYVAAFQDFDKAVFHDHGDTSEPFRWRGLTRQHLHQPVEAEQDLAKAAQVQARATAQPSPTPPESTAFVNRNFLLNAGLTVLTAAVLLLLIKRSDVIHWPYLWASGSAVGIGYREPRKGWALAIFQALFILVGYYVVVGPNPVSTHREVEAFSLFGSVALTFIGSLVGSVLKKAQ